MTNSKNHGVNVVRELSKLKANDSFSSLGLLDSIIDGALEPFDAEVNTNHEKRFDSKRFLDAIEKTFNEVRKDYTLSDGELEIYYYNPAFVGEKNRDKDSNRDINNSKFLAVKGTEAEKRILDLQRAVLRGVGNYLTENNIVDAEPFIGDAKERFGEEFEISSYTPSDTTYINVESRPENYTAYNNAGVNRPVTFDGDMVEGFPSFEEYWHENVVTSDSVASQVKPSSCEVSAGMARDDAGQII